MESTSNWPWTDTLAMANKGDLCQVEEVLFDSIENHLQDMGVGRGSVVECLDSRPQWLLVRLPDGNQRRISRDYAWFVRIQPTGNGGGAGNPGGTGGSRGPLPTGG